MWAVILDDLSGIILYSHNNIQGTFFIDKKSWSFEMLSQVAKGKGKNNQSPADF